jgi:hypothetical protein
MTTPHCPSFIARALLLAPLALLVFPDAASARADDAASDPVAPAEPAAAEPSAAAAPAEPAPAEPLPAEEPLPPAEAAPPPEPSKPAPPPYSLPFQLRPVVAGSVIRLDNTVAFYKGPEGSALEDESGTTFVSLLLASYKVTDWFAPLVRVGVASNSPPGDADGSTNFLNPALGGTFAFKPTPETRLALFLGLTIPVGSGGGNGSTPDDVAARATNAAGAAARSAMDNAMFATSYFTVFPGVGFAFVKSGFTAQVEATLLQLTRVKGDEVQKDESKTNFTTGLHLGYFVIPELSIAAELRHQRWLSDPTQPDVEAQPALRDNTTVAFGPRVHLKFGEKVWFRPALAFALPLDEPLTTSKHKMLQLDLPVAF